MSNINIGDLKLTAEDMTQVKGGRKVFPKVEIKAADTSQRIGLLLPAVQKIS